MAITYDELSKKTVAEMREMAKGVENEALKGYSTMHKEQLLPILCKVLEVELHAHHIAGHKKLELKAQIRQLRAQRIEALKAHDGKRLAAVRGKIHNLKREVRKLAV
jgi:protein-arginine kinase activator protein McsA